MTKFSAIQARASERVGGNKALTGLMPKVKTSRAVAATKNDRWLAQMTRCVFQAGFVWRVVDNKWDDFEDVFFGFPPEKIVLLSPEQLDKFSQNPRIIRNRQKVLTVQHNAHFIQDVTRQYGNFGKFVSQWPDEDLIGLFAYLKKHGARLGGMSGQRVLRNMGRDTFVVTGDVTRCLISSGLDIKPQPTSQREMKLIQSAFNHWHEESGLPYAHISRIAALSVG